MGGRSGSSREEIGDQHVLGSHRYMVSSGSLRWDEGGGHLFGSERKPTEEAQCREVEQLPVFHFAATHVTQHSHLAGETNSYAHAKSQEAAIHLPSYFNLLL